MPVLRFNLLENALDSLTQGVEFTLNHNNNPSKLKVAILLVTQAVELVLKERLKQEHWSLIFRNVEQAGNDDAPTVSIKEAKKRLERIAGVNLDERDGKTITSLQKSRNRIQHYEIELSFEQALSQINAAIGFLIRFLHHELGTDIRECIDEHAYQRLLEVEEILEGLRAVARHRIEEIRRGCQPVRTKHRALWHFEVIRCPNCWEEFYLFSESEHLSNCELCGYEGGFAECSRCGEPFPLGSPDLFIEDVEGYSICESCWSYVNNE